MLLLIIMNYTTNNTSHQDDKKTKLSSNDDDDTTNTIMATTSGAKKSVMPLYYTNTKQPTFVANHTGFLGYDFLGNSRIVGINTTNQNLILWDVATRTTVQSRAGNKFQCCAVSPDNKFVASGAAGGVFSLFDAQLHQVAENLILNGRTASAMAFWPMLDCLACCMSDGTLHCVSITNWPKVLCKVNPSRGFYAGTQVIDIKVSPTCGDRAMLTFGYASKFVSVIDSAMQKVSTFEMKVQDDTPDILSHVYSSAWLSSSRIASAGEGRRLVVWDANTGKSLLYKDLEAPITVLASSIVDVTLLAVGLNGGPVSIWSFVHDDLWCLTTMESSLYLVSTTRIRFSHDAQLLACEQGVVLMFYDAFPAENDSVKVNNSSNGDEPM
jgi:WD40 repeat protein